MSSKPQYWFPAKCYGCGWGTPTAWQGWAVLLVFFALLTAGAFWLLSTPGPLLFVGYVRAAQSGPAVGVLAQGRATSLARGNR